MNLKARFSDLPLNLQHDVLQNILDIECKPADLTQNQLNTLNALSPEELWNSYLEWNGLIHWAGPLVRAHAEIFEEPVLHNRFSDLPATIQSDLIQHKFDYDYTLEHTGRNYILTDIKSGKSVDAGIAQGLKYSIKNIAWAMRELVVETAPAAAESSDLKGSATPSKSKNDKDSAGKKTNSEKEIYF